MCCSVANFSCHAVNLFVNRWRHVFGHLAGSYEHIPYITSNINPSRVFVSKVLKMYADEEENVSDGEFDENQHSKLIENVINLTSAPHVKKPSRTEPAQHISEYNLSNKKSSVRLKELAKSLSDGKLARKLESLVEKSQPLRKPLEKPVAERIKRSVGYRSAKTTLDKWEPVVSSQRANLHLSFPLEVQKFEDNPQPEDRFTLKSELQLKLEEAYGKNKPITEEYHIEEPTKTKVTYEELLERRKEAAKIRAHQSYRELKARKQNKIKSKKFHRVQKKEKLKQQLKEFEYLQKNNPEKALEKLEEIERVRAEERASLRHRSTGHWAKNQQVRAKYDKENRQALAEQLSLSRTLTQKLQESKSESDEEDEGKTSHIPASDPDNIWTRVKTTEEINEFVTSYRKFWEDKNKEQVNVKDAEGSVAENANGDVTADKFDESKKDEVSSAIMFTNSRTERKREQQKANEDPKKVKIICVNQSGDWSVEPLENKIVVDEIFDGLQKQLHQKLTHKPTVKKQIKQNKNSSNKINRQQIDYLSLPKKLNRPIVDEPLLENPQQSENSDLITIQKILEQPTPIEETTVKPTTTVAKTVNIKTDLPDVFTTEDNNSEHEDDAAHYLSDPFVDDDVAADFTKEKKREIEAEKPKDVDLTLPGWGSWGGTGIKVSKKKRKRFIVRFPEVMKRRDENKGLLVINEQRSAKVREHQVSEVPFPFTSVKDYEASVRAPIGREFVPENAFKKMISPAVRTKMGKIIEPMTEEMLLKVDS